MIIFFKPWAQPCIFISFFYMWRASSYVGSLVVSGSDGTSVVAVIVRAAIGAVVDKAAGVTVQNS